MFCVTPTNRGCPSAVSLTEPVMLTGPPNSFCSALSVRSHLSSVVEILAPTDNVVSVGRMLKRTAWLVAQLDGVTVTVFAFDVTGDRIRHIWVVRNPEKLRPWTTG